jgi:pimeloyl-ACP methyl ester carboxylesterase
MAFLTRPVFLGIFAMLLAASASAQEVRVVEADGHRLRVRVGGLEHLGTRPVVVFEGGAGQRLETWDSVFKSVAAFAPAVAYDRAGLGESDADAHLPTPEHVARTLHALLPLAGVKPPYVLVGHSWGGPLIRMFAGLYPTEIAGMVYVDPTDLRTEAQDIEYFHAQGYTDETRLKRKAELAARFPGGGGEYQAIRDTSQSFFKEFRTLPRMPDVPVTVLMSARFQASTWAQSPCVPEECQKVWIRFRTEWLGAMAREVGNGTLIASTGSGHFVQGDDPFLVLSAIERVVRLARR